MWKIVLALLIIFAFIFYIKRNDYEDCECFQNYLLNTFYKWPNCNNTGCLHSGVNTFGIHPQSQPFSLWKFNNSSAVPQHNYDQAPVQTRAFYKHW